MKEYLRYLDIAMGSSGEFHSSIYAMQRAKQISSKEFENIDILHYKLENGLIKLVQSLQEKLKNDDWNDTLLDNNP